MFHDGPMNWVQRLRSRLTAGDAATAAGDQSWQRTVVGLSAALSLSMAGMGFVQPFIPLYLQDLGVVDPVGVRVWAGAVAAAGAVAFAVSAPFWGIISDRVGRKPMVLRAMLLGGAASIGMAFVGSAPELAVVRTLQGLVSGPGLASFALASGVVPRDRLLRAMGIMQLAMLGGNMIGPTVGGFAADAFGMRATLMVGGAVQAAGGLVVWFAVRERFQRERPAGTGTDDESRTSLADVVRQPVFIASLGGFIALAFMGNGSLPLMALYVQELGAGDRALTITGLLQGGYSVAAGAGSYMASRLAVRFGLHRTILATLAGAAVVMVPMGLVASFGSLVVTRILQGMLIGVTGPSIQSLVSQTAPAERRGTVFGLIGAATGVGAATGPLATGALAARAGRGAAVLVAAGTGGAGAAWFGRRLRPWRRDPA